MGPLWTDRHDLKHYLPATMLAVGNNLKYLYVVFWHSKITRCPSGVNIWKTTYLEFMMIIQIIPANNL